MRRRLQNKRASQLRPLNSGRKRQESLWGTWPQQPIAHSLRERGLSIYNEFDMPRFSNPCRDSKYHRYDFEFLEQSPVNNKQANDTSLFMRHSTRRKPECSIAAKKRTLGSEQKFIGSVLQRVAPLDLTCMRPRLAITPIRPQYQHGVS